jgi:predicted AlkP superfamily pyrophosphatase or phosphodiesterase
MRRLLGIALGLSLSALWAAGPLVKHVVVIGVDGLGVTWLPKAKTPNFDAMRETGSWTFHARGVMPTVSSPNWASMIMGAGPEQHGVTSNDWKPDKYEFPPTVRGPAGIFPTMFGALRQQRPDAAIGIYHHWDEFARLVEPGIPSVIEHRKTAPETMARAVEYLKSAKPALLFVHLDHVDDAGHEHGHGSPEYLAAIAEADRLTGTMLAAVKEAAIDADTVVIVTADHGGLGTKHGGNTLEELEIPWMARGANIRKNHEITTPVDTYDTAATVVALLGLTPPDGWIGKPVRDAFLQ